MYWRWSNYLKCVLFMEVDVSVCWGFGRGVGAGFDRGVVYEVDIGAGN